jgi:hypothetical protein
VEKGKRVDVYLEVRKRRGHIFLNEISACEEEGAYVRLIYISVSTRYRCSCRHVTRRVLLTRQDLPIHVNSSGVFLRVTPVMNLPKCVLSHEIFQSPDGSRDIRVKTISMFVSSFYTTGVVNKAGLAYSTGAPEITPGFHPSSCHGLYPVFRMEIY